jgi:phage shock protein PspC (stress-responsive transcriptional regulator)
MQVVVVVSLNGNSFSLDEPGYKALLAYLDDAKTKLAGNPDAAEILADLEQAVADKCRPYLGDHKTVVTSTEVARILEEMGPVQSGEAADKTTTSDAKASSEKTGPAAGAPKRLYLIRQGGMIAGLCNGVAAYFNIDVTIVRVIFVILAFLSHGLLLLLYAIMIFVIPYAETSEEHAVAHGLPFTAQQIVEQAKKHYETLKATGQREWKQNWQRQWRQEMRQWKREALRARRQLRKEWARPVGYAAQVRSGFLVPLFALLSAAFFMFWILILLSLVTTGMVLGWAPPASVPLWAAIVILLIVAQMVSWPINAARRTAAWSNNGYGAGWLGAWDGILWLGFMATFCWLAYHHLPQVKHLFEDWPNVGHDVWQRLKDSWRP